MKAYLVEAFRIRSLSLATVAMLSLLRSVTTVLSSVVTGAPMTVAREEELEAVEAGFTYRVTALPSSSSPPLSTGTC